MILFKIQETKNANPKGFTAFVRGQYYTSMERSWADTKTGVTGLEVMLTDPTKRKELRQAIKTFGYEILTEEP